MTKEQALHNFWSSFGLKAYDENTVPDEAKAPYITYEVAIGYIENEVALVANLWYEGNNWSDITDKVNEIGEYIGYGGVIIAYDGGGLWIKRGTPFYQRMADDSNEQIRRIVINISAEYLSA